MDAYTSQATKPLFRAVQVVRYLFGLLEILLIFRFALRLAGANPYAGFTNLIYVITYPFVAPFLAVFRITIIQGRVFDWTTLLALLVYALIEWGIIHLLLMSKDVSTAEAAGKLEKEENG